MINHPLWIILVVGLTALIFLPIRADAEYSTNFSITQPSINGQSGTDITLPLTSPVILSTTVSNKNDYAQGYVMIFEIRDSSGITVDIQMSEGRLVGNAQASPWILYQPITSGNYVARLFAIDSLTNLQVLTPVETTNLTVAESFTREIGTGPSEQDQSQTLTNPTLDDLKQYALRKINDDRVMFGLEPVKLSDNQAAQVHAEDVLDAKLISHWITNGEKPYMTYTRYGGLGGVGQNVAYTGYDKEVYDKCVTGEYYCLKVNPFEQIELHQYGMMYDDEECCENGHRDNILNKLHTHVSIGMAFDDYTFVIVQNFEDLYIDWNTPISYDESSNSVTLRGSVVNNLDTYSNNDLDIYVVDVYYDPTPTEHVYQENKDRLRYDLGERVAVVTEPAPFGYYYNPPSDYALIEADSWQIQPRSFDITFSLASVIETREEGVYTLYLWCENSEEEAFTLTSYSIFVNS